MDIKTPDGARKGLRSLAAKITKLMGEKHLAPPPPPAQDDFALPPEITAKFDADEVEVLRKIYKELNTRSTQEGIDKETFVQYFPLPSLWGDRLFLALDTKKCGRVDYPSLMQGLASCCRGTKAEKIKVLFNMFDLNGDGRVSRDELMLLLSCVPMIESYLQPARGVGSASSGTVNCQVSRTQSKVNVAAADKPEEEPCELGDLFWRRRRCRSSSSESTSFSSGLDSHLRAVWLRTGAPDTDDPQTVPRFCSTTSWKSSSNSSPIDSPRRATTSSHPQDIPSSVGGEHEERYIVGAGPSPMIAELLAEANEGAVNHDVEAMVSAIMESYDASEEDSLSLAEFRSFIEHHPRLLRLFSDCLREEVWGLHGHALYRPQRQAGSSFAASLLPSARPTRPASVVSGRPQDSTEGTQTQKGDSGEYPIPELIQLEKWIKLQQLFNQAAPKQMSHNVLVNAPPPSQRATLPDRKKQPPEPALMAAESKAAVYPRHSRYAGSREVLDFLEVSLEQYASDEDEKHPPPIEEEGPSHSAPPTQGILQEEPIWREKRDALSCPNCQSPLLVCPICDRRFPILRMSARQVLTVECQSCSTGEPKQFTSCWICQWPFAKALELLDRHDVIQEGVLWKFGKHSRVPVPRHFVLVDKLLYYYAKHDDCIPKGFVFLEGCYVDPIAAPESQMFGFCIIHAGGQFGRRELFAADEETRDRWINALKLTMNQQPIHQLFTLHEIIGQGKFSLVYRATEISTKEEYAVKVINKTRMSPHEKELLRGEMSIMRLLRHPHVIFLKSLVASREILHIVMELVPGGELFDAIATRTRVNEMTVNRLTSQLLRTLLYLHKSGIVHRDLKPENVLLTSKNVDEADVKIADFGLSCVCGPTERLFQPCGTLVYVAPEVLTLQGYNHQVDLWSLGVIVYLLLCGRLPFPIMRGSGVAVLTERERFYTPKFELPAWRSVSRSAQDFIRRLLEIDPAKRLTAQEALNHIWIKNPTAVLKDVTLKRLEDSDEDEPKISKKTQ